MTTDPKDAEIARYNLTGYDRGTEVAHEGEWVRHSDHAAEIARLTAALAESEAAAEGALMILVQTQAERDAQIARLTAELFEMTRSRGEWHNDFRALEKVIVGDTGLSAMTVAAQARLFRPRAEKAEAERDAALALVAAAYEAAAQIAENDKTLHEWEHTAAIRALTPADALAALDRRDAQMRAEGRKEGLQEAAGIADQHNDAGYSAYSDGWHHCSRSIASAILAAAEKEKL